MKRSISKIIYPRGQTLVTTHTIMGRTREVRSPRPGVSYFTGNRLPRVPYRVTYTLDPEGEYRVTLFQKLIRWEYYQEYVREWAAEGASSSDPLGFRCCFVPASWVGKRVRREVEPIVEVLC